jgi:transposase
MIDAEEASVGRRGRRRWSVSEKLQIVQLTMEPEARVAEIGRAHGVNANQVFGWRRLFENGQLSDAGARSTALLPVTISADAETRPEPADATAGAHTACGGAIHIELPGRTNISVECGADLALLRCVLESLRK